MVGDHINDEKGDCCEVPNEVRDLEKQQHCAEMLKNEVF